jgi:hypothetical protein
VAGLFWAAAAGAADNRPLVDVPATDPPPVVDGRLDDRCWRGAALISNFTQVLPEEGAPPTESTEVRLLRNRDYLFIGVRCSDHTPERVTAKSLQHDSYFDSDDKVQVVLDTFDRQREGYYFAVNPAGTRAEGLVEDSRRENPLWDTIWWARARVDGQGWTAEIAIPFKSLSFQRGAGQWGLNVERVIRHKQERVRWTGINRAQSVSTLADMGTMGGLTNLSQGWGLEVKPSLALKWLDPGEGQKAKWELRPSLDLTYNLTPSLKANATFNTDFAETEVDDRVVNLTRFPLFFPEKRDFFLQDSDIFRFGSLPASTITPYYSRRVGLSPEGEPVDILAGGRLTGRVNGTRIALLDAQQEAQTEVPSKNLLVGRVATPVLAESDVGGLFTYGDPRGTGDAALGGLDFSYLNSRLAAGKTLTGHAWFMGTTSDQVGGQDYAAGGDLNYPNEPFGASLSLRHIGEQFDPALGFVRRTGVRDYNGSVRYVWRPNTIWLRSISLDVRPRFLTDLDNRLVAEDHDLPSLTLSSAAGDMLGLLYSNERDRLDEPFEIQPGIVIPTGDYRMNQYQIYLESSAARPVGAELRLRTADFYTGERHEFYAGLSLRPFRYMSAHGGWLLTQVRLPEGNFDVRIPTGRLTLALSPDLSWVTTVQYDNLSDNVGLFSRIRWTYQPGSDLFLVLNHGFEFDDGRFTPLDGGVTVKIGATFRF